MMTSLFNLSNSTTASRLKPHFGVSLLSAIAALLVSLLVSLLISMTSSVSLAEENDTPDPDEEELPYGLYFVPWPETAPGEIETPATRLYVEPLSPIDIEVFEREVYYYEFLSAEEASAANSNGSQPTSEPNYSGPSILQ